MVTSTTGIDAFVVKFIVFEYGTPAAITLETEGFRLIFTLSLPSLIILQRFSFLDCLSYFHPTYQVLEEIQKTFHKWFKNFPFAMILSVKFGPLQTLGE